MSDISDDKNNNREISKKVSLKEIWNIQNLKESVALIGGIIGLLIFFCGSKELEIKGTLSFEDSTSVANPIVVIERKEDGKIYKYPATTEESGSFSSKGNFGSKRIFCLTINVKQESINDTSFNVRINNFFTAGVISIPNLIVEKKKVDIVAKNLKGYIYFENNVAVSNAEIEIKGESDLKVKSNNNGVFVFPNILKPTKEIPIELLIKHKNIKDTLFSIIIDYNNREKTVLIPKLIVKKKKIIYPPKLNPEEEKMVKHTLSGTVVDSKGTPIVAAEVTYGNITVYSDKLGKFLIESLEDSSQQLTITKGLIEKSQFTLPKTVGRITLE